MAGPQPPFNEKPLREDGQWTEVWRRFFLALGPEGTATAAVGVAPENIEAESTVGAVIGVLADVLSLSIVAPAAGWVVSRASYNMLRPAVPFTEQVFAETELIVNGGTISSGATIGGIQQGDVSAVAAAGTVAVDFTVDITNTTTSELGVRYTLDLFFVPSGV